MSDPAGRATQPPADALLWRVQALHHEVVCYAVATGRGDVVCVATDGHDDLLVRRELPDTCGTV